MAMVLHVENNPEWKIEINLQFGMVKMMNDDGEAILETITEIIS